MDTVLELERHVFGTDVSKNMLFGACLPPEHQSSYLEGLWTFKIEFSPELELNFHKIAELCKKNENVATSGPTSDSRGGGKS